jgi:hypothetical protein
MRPTYDVAFKTLTCAHHKNFGNAAEKSSVGESNVSGFEQTVKSIPNKVCAVPLWMLQVPRPEARPAHNAREFCVRIGSKSNPK